MHIDGKPATFFPRQVIVAFIFFLIVVSVIYLSDENEKTKGRAFHFLVGPS